MRTERLWEPLSAMTAGKAMPSSLRIGNPSKNPTGAAIIIKALVWRSHAVRPRDMGRVGDCVIDRLFESVLTRAGGNTPGQPR